MAIFCTFSSESQKLSIFWLNYFQPKCSPTQIAQIVWTYWTHTITLSCTFWPLKNTKSNKNRVFHLFSFLFSTRVVFFQGYVSNIRSTIFTATICFENDGRRQNFVRLVVIALEIFEFRSNIRNFSIFSLLIHYYVSKICEYVWASILFRK